MSKPTDNRPAGVRFPTPEQAARALLADIVRGAVEAVHYGDPVALEYVEKSKLFVHHCNHFGIDVQAARKALRESFGRYKTEPRRAPTPEHKPSRVGAYPTELYREIHAVYMAEKLTVVEAARRFNMNASTVQQRFYALGLPDNGVPRNGKRRIKQCA